MIYASACFWLAISVMLAWATHSLWLGMMKPKTVNLALLPGTVVTSLGRIIALLITGAAVEEEPAAKPGEKGDPGAQAETVVRTVPKMAVVGPCIVGLLPMAFLAILIYGLVSRLGSPFLEGLPVERVAYALPLTTSEAWEQLRNLTYLAEYLLAVAGRPDAPTFETLAFVYLLTSLTIRLAPHPGNIRGHLGAVFCTGMTAFLAGSVYLRLPELIELVWPVLALCVGWLALLLILSLLARGVVMSVRAVVRPEG